MISIIVPAYNVEDHILQTLDSIMAQTYPDLEIIVVDDGSSDNTGALVDAFASRHPQKIRPYHTPNSGVTGARLFGIRQAQGEWLGFADGDDWIEPDMYERLINNARKYDADISHCGYRMVFADGRTNYFYNSSCLRQQDNTSGLTDLLNGTLIEPSLCNKLFRRELFEPLLNDDVMPENVKINEDLMMNFILFIGSQKSVFEDVCPYHYLVRQGSATHRDLTPNRIYDPIRVKQRILELAPEAVQQEARAAYMRTCISVYNSIALSDRRELEEDRITVRGHILEHFDWAGLLSWKQRLLAWLIRYLPWVYRPLYGFYSTHLQHNPYQ